MKKITLILMALVLISLVNTNSISAEESKIYNIFLKYEGNSLNFKDINVIQSLGSDKKYQPIEGYTAKLFSFEENILFEFKFDIPNKIFVEGGGIIDMGDVNFTIDLPYFSNGKIINIYDFDEEKIFEVDVGQFATQVREQGNAVGATEGTDGDIKKTGQKVQMYFKEEKIGSVVKYIIYAMIIFMFLVIVYVIYTKFIDKYRLMKAQKNIDQ